jgi:hypothetical protein
VLWRDVCGRPQFVLIRQYWCESFQQQGGRLRGRRSTTRSATQGLQAPPSRFKVKRAAHMPDGAVKEEDDGGAAPSLEQFHDWVDQLQFTTGTTTTPTGFGMRSVGSVAAIPRRTDSAGEKGSSSDGYGDGAGV